MASKRRLRVAMHTRIKAEIVSLAQANPAEEVCGYIYHDLAGTPHVLPCRNIAADPTSEFQISTNDQIRAMQAGRLLGIYHSHPTDDAFSPADLECAEQQALPFYLVNAPTAKWSDYIPPSYEAQLEGRHWCVGFHDCYSIPRDYYREKFHVYMGDYERDESAQFEQDGTIMARYEGEGFERIEDVAGLAVHDVLMFRNEKAVPQHFAVYLGGNRLLHHHRGHLSCVDILTDRWLSRLFGVFRYKTALV